MNLLELVIVGSAVKLNPQGFYVTNKAPNTFQHLLKYYNINKALPISNEGNDKTIYTTPFINVAARAFHDRIHLKYNYSFSLVDEIKTTQKQIDYIFKKYSYLPLNVKFNIAIILYIEIILQGIYLYKTKNFVKDQHLFTKLMLTEQLER